MSTQVTIDVVGFYDALGVKLNGYDATWYSGRCVHPDHDDRKASASYHRTGSFNCHGCGAHGSGYAAAKLATGNTADAQALCSEYGISHGRSVGDANGWKPPQGEDVEPPPLPSAENLAAYHDELCKDAEFAWKWRGWSRRTIEARKLGKFYDYRGIARIVIPIYDTDDSTVISTVAYAPVTVSGDDKHDAEIRKVIAAPGRRRELYPAPEVFTNDSLWIVEGEADAITMWELGLPAVGLPSWQHKFDGSRFNHVNRVNICMDADKQGRDGALLAANELRGHVADIRIVDIAPERDDGYDVGDMHKARRSSSNAVQAVREILLQLANRADNVATYEATSEAPAITHEVDEDIPDIHLGEIPSFPVDVLPKPARELVMRYGDDSTPPRALVAGAALTAAAGAIGGKARIEIIPTWHERAIIWSALIAPRGSAKSAAQTAAFMPLREYDRTARREHDDAEVPKPYGAILGKDFTLEALAKALLAANGSMTIDIDELTQMLEAMGEYKRGAGSDRGRMLALWEGSDIDVIRVGTNRKGGNEHFHVDEPTLCICGTLQKDRHELLGGDTDGFRPRWLPFYASLPRTKGALSVEELPRSWRDTLLALVELRGNERIWTLTAKARVEFEKHRHIWLEMRGGVETASVKAALEKADRYLARYSLDLAELSEPGKGGHIKPETINDAAVIVNYNLDVWRALPEQGGLSLSYRDAKLDKEMPRLIAWLEDRPEGYALASDLLAAHVAGVRTKKDRDAMLERYSAQYPGRVEVALTSGRPGLHVYPPKRGVK